MSEYQHYEWLAIDRPLNDAQLRAVEALSSHMDDVTTAHALVTYSWGDFKHNPIKVLTQYFDAYLYTANWGDTHLAFRFTHASIADHEIEPYLRGDQITLTRSGAFSILEIALNEQEGGGWVDVDGVLAQAAGVRQQIIARDYRALYLAWLAFSEHDDEDYDDEGEELIEPPVPSGLDSINGPLKAFCGLFNIGKGLIKAAAKASPPIYEPSLAVWRAALAKLPRERCEHFLLLLLNDTPQSSSALRKELLAYRSVIQLRSIQQSQHRQSPQCRRSARRSQTAGARRTQPPTRSRPQGAHRRVGQVGATRDQRLA